MFSMVYSLSHQLWAAEMGYTASETKFIKQGVLLRAVTLPKTGIIRGQAK